MTLLIPAQEAGQYRMAHKAMTQAYLRLMKLSLPIPYAFREALIRLHR